MDGLNWSFSARLGRCFSWQKKYVCDNYWLEFELYVPWIQIITRLFVCIESYNYLWNLGITSVIIFIIGAVITRPLTNCKPDDKLSSSASAKEAAIPPFRSSTLSFHVLSSCQLSLFFWPPIAHVYLFFNSIWIISCKLFYLSIYGPFRKFDMCFYALTCEFLLFFTTLFDFLYICRTFVRKK